MSFIVERKVWLRIFALALFIISLLGPWMFDLISVPAQYPCDKPFVRLYGDFCGYPMSGFGAAKWAAGGFSYILGQLIKGNFAPRLPELIVLMSMWIIVLPFFSTLLLIGNQNSLRLQTINVILWMLACLPSLTLFTLQANSGQLVQFFSLLWGLWIYILLALSTTLFEVLVMRVNTKPNMNL